MKQSKQCLIFSLIIFLVVGSGCGGNECKNEDSFREPFTVELPPFLGQIMGCELPEDPVEQLFVVNQDIFAVFHCDGIGPSPLDKWGAEMHISGICRDQSDTFDESWSLPEQNGFECSELDGYREMSAFESDGFTFSACADPVYLSQSNTDLDVTFQLQSPQFSNCDIVPFDKYHVLMRTDWEFQHISWNGLGSCFNPVNVMQDGWFSIFVE